MADKQNQNEEIGSLTGIAAGALAGASVGSALFPVVGTFAGALVGGIVGSAIGRTVGGAVLDSLEGGAGPATEDITSQLERLGQLKEKGLISDEEFAAAKAKILG